MDRIKTKRYIIINIYEFGFYEYVLIVIANGCSFEYYCIFSRFH